MDRGFDEGMPLFFKAAFAGAVLIVCLVPVLVYLGYRQRKAIMAYAAAQGWTYRDYDPELGGRWVENPFVQGYGARAEAVIAGSYRGFRFAAFAYTYRTSSTNAEGKTEFTTHTVPVVALILNSRLPDLDVRPEGAVGRVIGRWTNSDIQLESEEFNRAFTVRSDDREFASNVLNPRMMHDLLAYPTLAWSFRGGDLLSLGSWNGKPEKITRFLDHLCMVFHSVPEFVWADFGGRPQPVKE